MAPIWLGIYGNGVSGDAESNERQLLRRYRRLDAHHVDQRLRRLRYVTNLLRSAFDASITVPNFSGATYSCPGPWLTSTGFGYNSADPSVEQSTLTYRSRASAIQPAGQYSTIMVFNTTATF